MHAIGSHHALLAKHAPDFCLGVLAGSDVLARMRKSLKLLPPRQRERSSPLDPMLVFWLVLAMGLFRSLSIPNVFAQLMAAWRGTLRGLPLRPVTDGALAHARRRLGVAPVRHLFEDLAAEVKPAPHFQGRRVWAMDGTVLTVPDTEANEAAFGRHVASKGRSAFPQLRLVTLASALRHEIRAARWCRYDVGEATAARPMLREMGPGDLLLLDRGLGSIAVAKQLEAQGAEFLYRLRRDVKPRVTRKRAPGDYDVTLITRYLGQDGHWQTLTLHARMIVYTVDRETVRLLTNVMDERVSALELIELYHERWEVELAFDEIKTHLGPAASGTLDTTFRGLTGPRVEQELWATLALFNLLRRLMADAAEVHRLDPRQISFVNSLEVVRLALPTVQGCAIERLVPLYVQLMTDLGACALDRWRRARRAPRALKVKIRPYRHKAPGERCSPFDFFAQVTLGVA